MCSHHNGIKREINDRKIREKSPNTWKLNNTFPNNPWVNEEVSREIKKKRYTEPNANEMQHIKICGTQPNSAEMEIYSSDA